MNPHIWSFTLLIVSKGFKLRKLNSIHKVCLAGHEHQLGVQGLINFKVNITDEYGLKDTLDIDALVVKIKYNVIVGLDTIRDHDLTFRYRTIFSSRGEGDDTFCQPCGSEKLNDPGMWPNRTLGVTAPSTDSESETDKGNRMDSGMWPNRTLVVTAPSTESKSEPNYREDYIEESHELIDNVENSSKDLKTNFSTEKKIILITLILRVSVII